MIYLGLDPGAGGGLAALDQQGGIVAVNKMPGTPREMFEWLLAARTSADRTPTPVGATSCWATLEKVSTSPQMGVVSAGTFMRGYGRLEMGLTAAGIPYDEVRPQVWQSHLGCLSKGDKNVTKARAQALWPAATITHALADALLLAEFGRRRALQML